MTDWADEKAREWLRQLWPSHESQDAWEVSLAALLREVAHATRMEAVKAATQMMGEQDDNVGQIWDRSAAVMKTDLLAEVRRVVDEETGRDGGAVHSDLRARILGRLEKP